MDNSLEGRVALVTGCTGGIGKESARMLGKAGMTVVGADLPSDGGDWSEGIAKADYHQLNVTDEADWERVISAIEKDHGRLDSLIHIAGVVVVEKLQDMSYDDWRKQMAVNVDGPFLGTKVATALLAKTGETTPHGSSMIIMSSVAGLIGSPLHTGYCASKAAVRMFSKACAMEFSGFGYKIRCNTIHPSGVNTGMVDHILQRYVDHGFAESTEAAREGLGPSHPIGRLAEPDDIAEAVRFLASDESRFVHGSELVIDGGYTAQ